MSEHTIRIDKELINYLRISYECPNCRAEVILTPDIRDKNYLTCGKCKYSLYLDYNQVLALKDLKDSIDEFDKHRKRLKVNHLQVWIQGTSAPSLPIQGSTSATYTRDKPSSK